MTLRLIVLLALSINAISVQAASLGEKCHTSTSNAKYKCSGSAIACLTAIKGRYCAHGNMTCGWPGTSGYQEGKKKGYKGKVYQCQTGGFKLTDGNIVKQKTSGSSSQLPSPECSSPDVVNVPSGTIIGDIPTPFPRINCLKNSNSSKVGKVKKNTSKQ